MTNMVKRNAAQLAQHIKSLQLDLLALRQMMHTETSQEPLPVPALVSAPEAASGQLLGQLPDFFAGQVSHVPDLGAFWTPNSMRQDLILGRLAKGQEWEPETNTLLRKYVKPGDFVMDVGAFSGSRSIRLSQLVGPEGCVYAWEPQTDMRAYLYLNLILNSIENVCILPYAAGSGYGPAQLYLNPTNRGASSINKGPDTTGGIRTVRMVPIDAVVPDRPVSFMQIDAEGSEYDVLLGARNTLTKHLPVLYIEVWDDDKRRHEGVKTTRGDVFSLLEAIGYQTPSVNAYPREHVILPRRFRAGEPT